MAERLDYVPTHSAIFHPRPRAFKPSALLIAMVVAAVVQVAASYFYIWFYQEYNDLVARLLACAGMSIGILFLCLIVCEVGEVSNSRIAALLSFAIAMLALYFSWIFWIQRTWFSILNNKVPAWRLVIHPAVCAQLIWHWHVVGVWTFHNMLVRGWPLLIVWIGEALVLVVPPAFFVTRMVTRKTPTCQTCRKRVERDGPLLRFSASDTDGFARLVLDRQFDVLGSYRQSDDERDNDESPRILMKLYRCPRCTDTHLLHTELVNFVPRRNASAKRIESGLIEYMVIGAEQAKRLKALHKQLEPQIDGNEGNIDDSDELSSAEQDSRADRGDREIDSDDPPSLGM